MNPSARDDATAVRPLGFAVTVEEWHQDPDVGASILMSQRERLPSLVAGHVDAWLALLARLAARATFFVDRAVVERHPGLLAAIAHGGHELRAGTVEEAIAAAAHSGARLRCVSGHELRRAPSLDAAAIDVACFRSWEIDASHPRVTAASRSEQERHYEGLDRVEAIVDSMRAARLFAPLVDALGLLPLPLRMPRSEVPAREGDEASANTMSAAATSVAVAKTCVSVVVPMFDEEDNVVFLLRSLDALRDAGRDRHAFEFVLVDDHSRDGTWAALQRACAGRSDIRLVRHDENRGVAAAIRTGCLAATHEVVASIDCDGSYDPLVLLEMIPMLDGADLVTASPYHRDGRVANVPAWRLALSRGLSLLYRISLRRRIATWTSCCRVMRKSLVAQLPLERGGFLGIAETLIRVVRRGGVVAERPATLSSRIFGHSKMKTLRTVRGHLGLLFAAVSGRVR